MEKRLKVLLVSIALLISLFLQYPSSVKAGEENILINEFLNNPTGSDTGKEWIELYNPFDYEVNISNWSIQTAGTSWWETVLIPEGYKIPGGSYFLICGKKVEDCDFNVEKIGMQNGGSATDGVRILNHDKNVIDTVLYDSPNFNELENDLGNVEINENCIEYNSENGLSIARKNFVDTDISKIDFYVSEFLTPGFENPKKLCKLSEFDENMTCSVEVYVPYCNQNNEFCVLHDGEVGVKAYIDDKFETESFLKKYLVLELEYSDQNFKMQNLQDTGSVERWELLFDKVEALSGREYSFIEVNLEKVYEDDNWLYFKTINDDLVSISVNNSDFGNDSFSYSVKGLLIPYSYDRNGNVKFQIIPESVEKKNDIVENDLANSGSQIKFIVAFLYFALFLLLRLTFFHNVWEK